MEVDQVTVELTSRCTYRCVYCRGGTNGDDDTFLEESLARTCLNESQGYGSEVLVELSGGEPLLHPRFWQIAAYARERFRDVLVVTNGSLISADVAQRMARLDVSVTVSLDSADEQTNDSLRSPGAYRSALSAISHLREAGVRKVLMNAAITRRNSSMQDLTKLSDLAGHAGVNVMACTPVIPAGRLESRWPELGLDDLSLRSVLETVRLLQALHMHTGLVISAACSPLFGLTDPTEPFSADRSQCGFGRNPSITATGEVIPCPMARTEVLGNVHGQHLREIMDGSQASLLRDKARLGGRCGVCPYRQMCGGCRVRAHFICGDHWHEDPYCWWSPELDGRLPAIELERLRDIAASLRCDGICESNESRNGNNSGSR